MTDASHPLLPFIVQHHTGAPDYHLLLSGARFCFLLLLSLVTLRAFGRRTGYFFGLSRPLLQRVAIYLQLLWFSTELVFGAALLSLLPVVEASTGSQFHLIGWTYTFANLVPIFYPMGLSGCVLFIQRLLKKKHHHHHESSTPMVPLSSIAASSSSAISSHDENLCSPSVSECSSISTTSSSGGFYNRSSFSPRGFCNTPGATCEIVLMEHVIDTNEAVLFVHKNLRPIKTRVEDKYNKVPTMLPQVHFNNKNQTCHHHRTASDDAGAMTVVPLAPV